MRGAIEGRNTTVRTDGLWSYRRLPKVGVRHEYTVQPSRNAAIALLPWSRTVFAHLKAWLRGTSRGVSRKHLASCLEEFSCRFNHRDRDEEFGGLILVQALGNGPLTYHRLVAEGGALLQACLTVPSALGYH